MAKGEDAVLEVPMGADALYYIMDHSGNYYRTNQADQLVAVAGEQDEGLPLIPHGQGYKDMSPPSKEVYRLLLEGRILHGGNPVLRWMAGNVVMEEDPAGNIKPTKAKAVEKIDGIVAMIMAMGRAVINEGSTGSVYDERGILSF